MEGKKNTTASVLGEKERGVFKMQSVEWSRLENASLPRPPRSGKKVKSGNIALTSPVEEGLK